MPSGIASPFPFPSAGWVLLNDFTLGVRWRGYCSGEEKGKTN